MDSHIQNSELILYYKSSASQSDVGSSEAALTVSVSMIYINWSHFSILHISFFVSSQQTSVEYAQLNHDANHYSEHSEHGNFSVQDEHVDTIDNSVDTSTADHGEWKYDPKGEW